jgi:DNA repair protein RadD
MLKIVLRPYQAKGVNEIKGSYLAGKIAPLYVLPTGGGKTVVFCYVGATTGSRLRVPSDPSQGYKRVLILVHRIELMRQTSAKLFENGIEHGLINSKFTPNYNANIQIASVQTLAPRIRKGKARLDYDLIIVDEAHHAVAGTWSFIINSVIKDNPKCKVMGVTATPIRTDGTGLGDIFDDIIIGPSIRELTDMGNLVRSVVYAPAEKLDLSKVKIKDGDFDAKDLESIVDNSMITGNAVDYYRKLCAHKPAIVFCCSKKHAEHVADEFRNAGFKSQAVDGETEDTARRNILNGLANGSVEVVTACDIISEGTDIPAVTCAILLRPTQSLGLFLQQVGRALRPAPGKTHAIILDHVGNCLTHGLPDDDREWSLEGVEKMGKRKKDEEPMILVKQCPQCFAMHKPASSCPQCGHVYQTEAREVDQIDGELRELTAEDKLRIKLMKNKEVSKAKTFEELKKIEVARGYKPGWAKHKWEARQKAASNHRPGPPPPTEMPAYVR